ncbi:GNAT family N-acetyltransferase [Alteromonas ponticola]|uniref:N-acetyltransferase n=1 Tax=Alteromonas ponticola TaxID=2720613 RepID=A0ABX1R5D6_9ALTE|nr:GNAT family N-acetyltransferase [Alteromonas ponticola]NMH61284.1 N-acetyltransferase [Alteromonas ponticola]
MITIRNVSATDVTAVTRIYNEYIQKTAITFEELPVSVAEMQQRIDAVSTLSLPWLVLHNDDDVIGYAYAAPWKTRSAYRFTAEVTIYLAPDMHGNGYGKLLYEALFKQLCSTEIRSCISVITLPNAASVALHEKMGMQKVAHFAQVGFKFGEWLDVGYWQIQLPKK